ncbi:hypothetical protein ABG768_007615 [Culter alburnus]|uniref:phosphatidate cytidylyltransferase n=1 Tax=Culter alburnus TaxID=194366 RepID=A0AAW1ZNQ4_CULAL
MVLLTLLGLTALFLRERREVKNTHSGPDEIEDQSDVLPESSTDGQTSQQINSDPEVLTTGEELTGHPEIDDDFVVRFQNFYFEHLYSKLFLPHLIFEDYSEPLPLVLQHQLSEDQQRDGASDNDTESDSEVPEVPVPADDTPGVLNKVLSGLSSQWTNWWERSSGKILTLSVISFFFFFIAIYLSPMTLMMSGLCVQIKFCEQIITTGHRVYYSYHMPWFRTLSLYFLLCVNNFFYGATIADYFFTLVQMEEYIHMFSKYQQFISFVSYLIGLCMFVLSLVRKHYRLQFCMFAWTHATLLIVAMHSRSIIQDLFDGTIWVIMPISICNDIMAWMFGFIVSWTFLI